MATDDALRTADCPRWVHLLAVATVFATLPLLMLGAEVTTRGVGMVDPRGFRWPWEIFGLLAQTENQTNLALVIELTHRLFGFLVGILAIALCVSLWLTTRAWKRWLGLGVLAAVVAQGLLGRYRVDLNALFGSTLALIHGCFAQLVFAFLVAVALWTSWTWNESADAGPAHPRLRHLSLVVAVLIFLQAVLGAVVRHRDFAFGARLHLLFAFVVVASVAWLLRATFAYDDERRCRRAVLILGVLVALQVILGMESWLAKFEVAGYVPRQLEPLPLAPELIRSAHYVIGAILFATSVVTVLLAHRQTVWATRTAPVPAGHLEGVA